MNVDLIVLPSCIAAGAVICGFSIWRKERNTVDVLGFGLPIGAFAGMFVAAICLTLRDAFA